MVLIMDLDRPLKSFFEVDVYELHYWDTNQSGSSHSGFESALVKLIYFPRQGRLENGTGYRLAVGIDYIHDLGDTEKGIGFGADQVGPFLGVALALPSGITVIPLLQWCRAEI